MTGSEGGSGGSEWEVSVLPEGVPWRGDGSETGESTTVELDELLELLSNRRRRYVWLCLSDASGAVSLRELSRRVAARETDSPPDDVRYEDRKSVYTSLQQYHCPKLAEHGLVRYDDQEGVVERTADVERAYRTEVEPWDGRLLPATVGALALTAGLVLAAWALGVAPFAWLSLRGVGVAVGTASVVASFVYVAFAQSTCWVSLTDLLGDTDA